MIDNNVMLGFSFLLLRHACCQLDSFPYFLGLQAQSTSRKKERACSTGRGEVQSGRDSWEWTRFCIGSEKTQSEEESPARILSVCTSHAHTQTRRYPQTLRPWVMLMPFFVFTHLHSDVIVSLQLVEGLSNTLKTFFFLMNEDWWTLFYFLCLSLQISVSGQLLVRWHIWIQMLFCFLS